MRWSKPSCDRTGIRPAAQERGVEDLRRLDVGRPAPTASAGRRGPTLLHGWDWLLFLAILFSCSAFGRIVSDTSWDVSPVNFIITASIAAAFWVAFFARLIWVRRKVYQATVGGRDLRS